MKEFVVRKRVALDASPFKIWEALTDPAKTKKYFFNCEVFSKWIEGSPITFKGKIFLIKKIEMNGKIVKIIPEKFLKYTLKNGGEKDSSAGFSTVTEELTYKNDKTVLSITDDVGTGEGAEKRYMRSLKGWDKVLKGLKKLVEEKK